MQVKVVLDQPSGNTKYTNLDFVQGRIILRVFQPSKVTYVIAKLEGESRTRLEAFDAQRGRNEQSLEIHKTQQVFPATAVVQDARNKQTYMLAPGLYEYPFQFKIPFNNACLANIDSHGPNTPFTMAGFNLEVSKSATHHVRTTLPPTMHQNLEAGIRYFVKATVNVPSMFKENPRSIQYLSFDPIEPPRTKGDGEAYARRQHQFSDNLVTTSRSKFSLGRLKSSAPSSPTTADPQLARFTIDMRLPNPAVLTCGQDVPMRLLVKSVGSCSKPLYLKTFQLELVGHTKLRAQRTERVVSTSWVLRSLSNLHYTIGNHEQADCETTLDKELHHGYALPDAVCPSFITCNIERSYELVASIGLAYGSTQPGQDQFVVIPLRHRVQVFSGIQPPDELLRRVAEQRSRPAPPLPAATFTPLLSARPSFPQQQHPQPSQQQQQQQQHAPPHPPRPPLGNSSNNNLPPGSGQHPEDPWLDPPPSYEDAMGDNIVPIPGPRPAGYNPGAGATLPGAQGGLFADEGGKS